MTTMTDKRLGGNSSEGTYTTLDRGSEDTDTESLHTEEQKKMEDICHKTTQSVRNVNRQ
jgi:hypothetical protein